MGWYYHGPGRHDKNYAYDKRYYHIQNDRAIDEARGEFRGPVKEATGYQASVGFLNFVSIHATVKEATSLLDLPRGAVIGFDPRHREGGDRLLT